MLGSFHGDWLALREVAVGSSHKKDRKHKAARSHGHLAPVIQSKVHGLEACPLEMQSLRSHS